MKLGLRMQVGAVVVARLQQQSEVSASGRGSQGFSPSLAGPPKPSVKTETRMDLGSPSLLAQDMLKVGEALGSTTLALYPRPSLPPGSGLRPPHPKAASGGECLCLHFSVLGMGLVSGFPPRTDSGSE